MDLLPQPERGETWYHPGWKGAAMQYRVLGKTGQSLSVVGFGGIVVRDTEPEEATRYVGQAIERGVTYFDVAPSYGNAQACLGRALEPYRRQVFLACKTGKRDRAGAEAELYESLRLLRTDHFDLYQFHSVTTPDDVAQIIAPGGALEAALAARDAGLCRWLGFSAHTEEAALALLEAFPFDSVLFPINWAAWHGANFGPRVAARVKELGIGLLALKTLALRHWQEGETRIWPKGWYKPVDTLEDAILAARFTLSKGVTAAVSPSHAELLWLLCDAAEQYAPITPEEDALLAARAQGLNTVFGH
jgi:aryl-alcohol dehydrogenase-like predicted oxidoreductase